jgi:predicted RNA-binding protein with PUA-like domain
MAYWLIKSEPNDYSFADLEREGQTIWDGVKNNLALKHMRNMAIGDLALFYHTGKERRIVGVAEVVSEPYGDPALDDPKRTVIDVKLGRSLHKPVTLQQIKQDGDFFADFDLVRIGRLSIMPVTEHYWQRIMELAGE